MCKMPTWMWLLVTAITWQVSSSKEESRIVCYYTNWSVYRPGTAKFNPQNINPYLCTHLVYAFGGFTKENNFKPFDKYQDIEKGGYAKFTGLKTYNKELKTMLAIGGWNEGSSRFSPLVASAERRKEFIKNSIKFLRQNHFDGLDLDWEYPSFRDGGKPRDKDNYATLVQELREEYDREAEKTGRPRLLLTMAVPAGIEYINKGYDVPKLMKYLDWMNILSYDYHSAFEPSVNHHSPLYGLEEASEYNYDSDLNINHTIEHYLEAGAEPNKLVLGIPTYGRSYTLFNPEASQIGDPADGPGEMGDATRENGYLAYYEICEKLKEDGWNVEHPNPNAMGPYAYKENQWVGYDDVDIVKKKAEFVIERNLGGIMFWSIDNDDFRGSCHDKPYPLIEAAKEALLTSGNRIIRNQPIRKTGENADGPGRKRTRPKPQRIEETAPKRKIKVIKSTTTTTTAKTTVVTPKYHTPEPPTTPDPGSDFKCEDEGFFPHPRDCKKYFWCLSSGPSELGIVAHQFTCPSGLYFNKAADSCDYTQNVRCVKSKTTTTTSTSSTSTSTSTTTSTSAPYFSTRRVSPRITATTSRTTTTASPEEYEYEYEDDVVDSEEDPRVLKELINLIKKVGGIEELEKQLHLHDNGTASVANSGTTTPSVFSKSLYERVLKNTKSTDNVPTINRATNSRGPQFSFSENESVRSRGRPQYTAINRQRSTTEKEDEQPEQSKDTVETKKKSNVPEYISIIRQRSSTTTESTPSVATEKSLIPEYVTIRRSRPTSEAPRYEPTSAPTTFEDDENEEENTTVPDVQEPIDHLNAVEHNSTNFEAIQRTTESISRRHTEPSTTTTKVSEPIPTKTISRPRPFSKNPTARTTEAPIPEEESVRDNKLGRRRGYTRFELPETYDEALPDPKYQDRRFRPNIASEISDLSSLTSADIHKQSNGNRRRIIARQRTTETTSSPVVKENNSTTKTVFVSRRPLRKFTTEQQPSSTTTTSRPTTTTRTTESVSRRRIIRRFRPTSTSISSTTSKTPEIRTEPMIVPTEKENLITDDDVFRTAEEEDENIKLSESNIREKSEIHFNELSNDGIILQKEIGNFGKTSHVDKATEEPNPFHRTRKIIRKLITSTTEAYTSATTPTRSRTRKIIRKIGPAIASTTQKIVEIPEEHTYHEFESTTETVARAETENPTFAVTTEEVPPTTVALTTAEQEYFTTSPISSTESTTAEKITPFYYRSKFSRQPFVLQRTKSITEPSTSTTQTRHITRNSYKRFERRKPSTSTTTTEKILTTTPAATTIPMVAMTEQNRTEETTVDVGTTTTSSETQPTTVYVTSSETTGTTPSTIDTPTTRLPETDTPTTPTAPTTVFESTSVVTRRPYQSRRVRPNVAQPTARKIEETPKSPNSIYKNNRTKNFKNKFTNRNYKTTTNEPTTIEQATLLHVFAETESPTTTTPPNDKIEKLIEVNRIVEVSLKEGKLKSNTMTENEITLFPVVDRIGAINRVTNIKVVDSEVPENNTKNFTPKPNLNSETSTIALEGLFRFRNDESNDELLETEHARYVNVKILRQDNESKSAESVGDDTTIPLRILPHEDEETTSKAEVVEISPKHNSGLIRIAPIAISLKDMSQRNISLFSV